MRQVAWTKHILVLSARTVGSDVLLDRMRRDAESGPTQFTVVVPGGPSLRADDVGRAMIRFRDAGLEVSLRYGDRDPLVAVRDSWHPGCFDEVIVATLPTQSSRWLAVDLPYRVQRLTDTLVTHVVAEPRGRGDSVSTPRAAAV
jgi:hypothetical protein